MPDSATNDGLWYHIGKRLISVGRIGTIFELNGELIFLFLKKGDNLTFYKFWQYFCNHI
jgi:hypothetical protein